MKKILIIDDEQDILDIAETLLKDRYEFHSASLIEDPVMLVTSIKPHLILIDYYIPTIGGKKAIELLKQNSKTRNIPIYLFSASPEIKSLAEDAGADGYFTKPFKIKEFMGFIDAKFEV